jgi:hypothetical protein
MQELCQKGVSWRWTLHDDAKLNQSAPQFEDELANTAENSFVGANQASTDWQACESRKIDRLHGRLNNEAS